MDSRGLNSCGRFLLVLLCALVASGPLLAGPDYEELKKEITRLEQQLPELQKTYRDASSKFKANKDKQAKADGNELAALKREGMKLSNEVAEAADKVRDLRQKIADKQGEVRESAADYAIERMNAQDKLALRVQHAVKAMEAWSDSLGSLPEVPETRDLSDFVDPLLKAAAKKEDKKRLNAFDDWAKEEEDRIEEELGKVEKLLGKKKVVEGADDEKVYLREADDLKKTLEKRQEQVKKLRESARDALKKLN